jgi:hypothetical protein
MTLEITGAAAAKCVAETTTGKRVYEVIGTSEEKRDELKGVIRQERGDGACFTDEGEGKAIKEWVDEAETKAVGKKLFSGFGPGKWGQSNNPLNKVI